MSEVTDGFCLRVAEKGNQSSSGEAGDESPDSGGEAGGVSCINPRWQLFNTHDHDLAMTLCGTWANSEETMLSFDSKSQSKYRHTLLYDTSQILHFSFTDWRFMAILCLNKSISEIFPTVFIHFVFLSHRGNFHDALNAPPAKRLTQMMVSTFGRKVF